MKKWKNGKMEDIIYERRLRGIGRL